MGYVGIECEQIQVIRRMGAATANDNPEPFDAEWEAFLRGLEERTDLLLKEALVLDIATPREVKAMATVWRMLDREARVLRARGQQSFAAVPPVWA
jgi:hypothetical protein